jgi:hypothetical protein
LVLAGAGFKLFQDGNVLLASEVQDFMMDQQIMVFADSTARDAAITSPSEGMFAFIKDEVQLTFFNGTIWKDF